MLGGNGRYSAKGPWIPLFISGPVRARTLTRTEMMNRRSRQVCCIFLIFPLPLDSLVSSCFLLQTYHFITFCHSECVEKILVKFYKFHFQVQTHQASRLQPPHLYTNESNCDSPFNKSPLVHNSQPSTRWRHRIKAHSLIATDWSLVNLNYFTPPTSNSTPPARLTGWPPVEIPVASVFDAILFQRRPKDHSHRWGFWNRALWLTPPFLNDIGTHQHIPRYKTKKPAALPQLL